MRIPKPLKKIISFAFKNYIITLFLGCIAFVGIVILWKLITSEPHYIFAKVKVSQGLWWASTQKPPLWLARSIKVGDKEMSLSGKPVVEVLGVTYYPWWASDQYDVYINLKLKVSINETTGTYSFKRSQLGVGSPIDLEFPNALVSATVVKISEVPFEEKVLEKVVTLEKNFAYPWEFEAIQKGDAYYNGSENIFEVLEKSYSNVTYLSHDSNNQFTGQPENRRSIIIKAKIKGFERNGNFVFGEEQLIRPGKTINIATEHFVFSDYTVAKVE